MTAAELFAYWTEARRPLFATLAGLSEEQAGFRPHPGFRSLRGVLLHTVESERTWIQFVAEGRPAQPEQRFSTLAALLADADAVHEHTRAYLATLDVGRLAGPAAAAFHGRTQTLAWILSHVQQHEAYHRGELSLMLGLMGVLAPEV